MTNNISFKLVPAAQRGVAALEFALVCTLFLLLFFGIASYGALMVVQQSLSLAAQEGARAMLQATLAPSPSTTPNDMACQAVARSVEWLTNFRKGLGLPPITCTPSVVACSYSATLSCGIVEVTYVNYRTFPLIPDLLPLGTWLEAVMGSGVNWIPTNLRAQGMVQIGAPSTV